MNKYHKIRKIQQCIYVALLCAVGIFVTSCDEKIVIGEIDESTYLAANQAHGYLKDASTMRKTNIMYLRDNAEINLSYGVSVTSGTVATASIGIDEILVTLYNADNYTDFKPFPANQVSFSNGGNVSVAAWQKESDRLTLSLSKEGLADGTYLLPVVVKSSSVETLEDQVVYYFVKVTSTPDIMKTCIQNDSPLSFMCYIEAKDIETVAKYRLTSESNNVNSGKPLFDMVILFAMAAGAIDEENGDVTLNFDGFRNYFNEHDKYIRSLKESGVTVLLGFLGGKTFGLSNMSGQMLTEFAANVKLVIDEYDLDGWDWDDEWTSYPLNDSNPYWPDHQPSTMKAARLMIELKRIMPDKIFSVYEYNGQDGNFVNPIGAASFTCDGISVRALADLGRHPFYSYGNRAASQWGLPNSNYSPVAFWPHQGSNGWTQAQVNTYLNGTAWINGKYGHLYYYSVDAHPGFLEMFNWMTPIVYGERTILQD